MSDTYDLFQQGRAYLREGMPAQATVSLEKAKKLEPNKASIREALGIAYFRIQRWKEAEAEFRAVLELAPTDDYAHYALGRALERGLELERRAWKVGEARRERGSDRPQRRGRELVRRVTGERMT